MTDAGLPLPHDQHKPVSHDIGGTMLPSLRNRLLITLTAGLGVFTWLFAVQFMIPTDRSSGLSLFASSSGVPVAILAALLAGIPVTLLGLVSAAGGHPLAGVFSVTASLAIAAATRGRMLGWVQRNADTHTLPHAYRGLMLEAVIWFVGLLAMLMVIQYLRSPLRSRIPALASHDHLGANTNVRFPNGLALAAGAITAMIGGLLCTVFIRSDATGQVVCGLLLSFTLASVAAQLIVRQANPVMILLAPLAVAMVGYGYVAFSYDTADQFIRAWQTGRVVGPALAMPVFFVSAAVAGCAIGVGLAQSMLSGDKNTGAPGTGVALTGEAVAGLTGGSAIGAVRGAAIGAVTDSISKLPIPPSPEAAEDGRPMIFAIDPDDHHAKHVGWTADGRQFILTMPFVPESDGDLFVALYVFDANGKLTEAKIDNFGPRDKLDRRDADHAFKRRIGELGKITRKRICIAPFKLQRFGVEFGLVTAPPDPDVEGSGWQVEMQPGNYMAFYAPWDSGIYDT